MCIPRYVKVAHESFQDYTGIGPSQFRDRQLSQRGEQLWRPDPRPPAVVALRRVGSGHQDRPGGAAGVVGGSDGFTAAVGGLRSMQI
jgi:hypothetical protein